MCLKNVNGFKRNRERVRDCFFLLGLVAVAVDVDDVAVATEEEAREQGRAREEEERRRVSKSW